MAPLNLALIGAGLHAAGQHLPALFDYEQRHPGSVRLAAVCDRDRERAAAAAAPSGAAVYDDWRVCLEQIRPDAVLACLPPALTPAVALAAAAAGAAVWVEKPLAPGIPEAEALCAGLETSRAMVSMNRRFEPAVTRLRGLIAGRQPRTLHAIMGRCNRCEADFITSTGVHIVDLAVALAGDPGSSRPTARHTSRYGAGWARITWETSAGCDVTVDIRPTLGINQEAVEMAGAGWRGTCRSAWFDAGTVDWHEAGRPLLRETIDLSLPDWRRNGTDAETAAFIAACRGEGPWSPAPAEVLAATILCHTPPEG